MTGSLFRRLLFWCHLVCGVAAGSVVLIMCVTGVALTYQKEMQYWADTRHYRTPPAGGATRASLQQVLAAVRQFEPSAAPTTVTWRSEPELPAAVAAGARTLYVNPYTSQVYGEGTGQAIRSFFATMTNWHRYVAMSGESRTTGRAMTGVSNLMFLFIVLSGMYLWWPRMLTWTQLRNVLWFRRGLRAKARDFNWHNAIGFWSALPLALVVYSGTVISYPWSSNLVYRAFGEQPPAPATGRAGGPGGEAGRGGGPGGRGGASAGAAAAPQAQSSAMPHVEQTDAIASSVDRSIDRVMADREAWQTIALRVPTSAAAPLVFTIDGGDAGQPHLRATLTVDPSTDETMKYEDFSSQSPGRRARTFLRFAHTGEIGGGAGQTIAGLVSAGGAVLVYTGFAMSLRRFLAWRRRRT